LIQWQDIAFLGVGGFLVGSLAYTAWYTTRYEPETKLGYTVLGIGAVVVVVENTWLDFQVDASHWFLTVQLIGFLFVAAGLALITKARRDRRR
jgi:hypothetical protein